MYKRGFSLIEAIATTTILMIIAGLVISKNELSAKREKEYLLRAALREIRTAIDAFKSDVDNKIIIRDEKESAYPKSLTDLVNGVKSVSGKKIYFLRRIPRDPFDSSNDSPEDTWSTRSSQSDPNDFSGGSDIFDIASKK